MFHWECLANRVRAKREGEGHEEVGLPDAYKPHGCSRIGTCLVSAFNRAPLAMLAELMTGHFLGHVHQEPAVTVV